MLLKNNNNNNKNDNNSNNVKLFLRLNTQNTKIKTIYILKYFQDIFTFNIAYLYISLYIYLYPNFRQLGFMIKFIS